MNKQIYVFDLLNRFAGYSFTETKENDMHTVTFWDDSRKEVISSTKMDLLDCYKNIRQLVLDGVLPQFRLTKLQIDALVTKDEKMEPGITVLDLDNDMSVAYNGTEWVSVAGKRAPEGE